MELYLSVLGRQPEISLAELSALFSDVKSLPGGLATFTSSTAPDISRLGGSMKLAKKLDISPLDYLKSLGSGKITLGVSDYSRSASARSAQSEALKLKKILTRLGRSVRVLPNISPVLSTATSHHNQLSEKKNHTELIKYNKDYFVVIGVQNITAYGRRDQARPARDARVGMLPPKLAQILINLCGQFPENSNLTLLDPFCGTGVVLQEALLMGYNVLGTDIEPRMIDYSQKNLDWLINSYKKPKSPSLLTNDYACAIMDLCVGDATDFDWQSLIKSKNPAKISAVACETYLGPPMSVVPPEIKLRTAKDTCRPIILGFLKNLSSQIESNTPVVIAVPTWLRSDGSYSHLNILDDIENMGYNVMNPSGKSSLLYYRAGQIVAREIIILRKS